MYIHKIFTEDPHASVATGLDGDIVQTGRGFAIFREDEGWPVVWHNGEPFELELDGCELIDSRSSKSTMYLAGLDHTGKTWRVYLGSDTVSYYSIWEKTGCKNVRLPHTLSVEVLKGKSFADAIESVKEYWRESDMEKLRSQAAKVQPLQEALAEIFKINKAQGPKSRAKVRDIILAIEPGLETTA